MGSFTVDYHGSQTKAHGRYRARPETECPHGRDHDGDYWFPDERLILSDPETGADVLFCVRRTSVTEIAPDGQPLSIPAVDGDLVELSGGRLVIFAGQEPAYRYGSDPYDEIHYYARSAGRWYIHTALLLLRGAPISRARYTSAHDRKHRLLTMDQEDHITYLRELRNYPDGPAYEGEADDLERVTQQLEALAP
ncbi:hypothetical protein J7I97_20435 [Streptomyces sp. ISL-87]|uniref:hypothetical protein n=1 Tax=Streptomyces sp. ISL-87 TaxID=2819188 RepID=UPI001BEC2597|nr:hypothetical protein [Streptomyces sp. ISL-87]MBT2610571.1 hypothetical protein [Streptomyces sp. ISL-87]